MHGKMATVISTMCYIIEKRGKLVCFIKYLFSDDHVSGKWKIMTQRLKTNGF